MKKLVVLMIAFLLPTMAFANVSTEETVETLNSLLRGEISAVETYRQALEKVENEPGAEKLRTYMKNHQEAVNKLTAEVTRLGGTPSTDSGAWGVWAKTVQGTAKIFGDDTALQALREGEEHGLEEYQQALKDEDVSLKVKQMIEDNLIPKQREHIAGLKQLIPQVS